MRNLIIKTLHVIRWQEWYDSKVPLFFICFYYLCLKESSFQKHFLIDYIIVILFASLFLAFGYYINDLSDIKIDKIVGKQKIIHSFSPFVAKLIAIILAICGIALALRHVRVNTLSLLVIGISYFFAIAYSLPPFRIKEKGEWGLIISALAQRSFPIMFVFLVFNKFGLDMILFFFLYFLIGIRWILVHQLQDLQNDLKSNTTTFATRLGYKKTRFVLYTFFCFEIINLIALSTRLFIKTPITILATILYVAILAINFILWKNVGQPYHLTIYKRMALADYYYAYWPFFLSVILVFKQPLFWPILVISFVWHFPYLFKEIQTWIRLLTFHGWFKKNTELFKS
jgi:4-hydroxybenzoate polyprenyltransferase